MIKRLSLLLPFAVCLSFASPALASGKISVTGAGSVTAAPDEAVISFGVQSISHDANQAVLENTKAMTKAFAAAKAAGITGKDIVTSGFSLRSSSYNSDHELRYTASNRVTITIHDLKSVGAVLDKLTAAGVNQVDSVAFDVSNPASFEAEARKLAAKNARAKAQDYASSLGLRIVGVDAVSSAGGGGPRPVFMMRAEAMAAPANPVPLAAGDQTISDNVNVVFLTEPAK